MHPFIATNERWKVFYANGFRESSNWRSHAHLFDILMLHCRSNACSRRIMHQCAATSNNVIWDAVIKNCLGTVWLYYNYNNIDRNACPVDTFLRWHVRSWLLNTGERAIVCFSVADHNMFSSVCEHPSYSSSVSNEVADHVPARNSVICSCQQLVFQATCLDY